MISVDMPMPLPVRQAGNIGVFYSRRRCRGFTDSTTSQPSHPPSVRLLRADATAANASLTLSAVGSLDTEKPVVE